MARHRKRIRQGTRPSGRRTAPRINADYAFVRTLQLERSYPHETDNGAWPISSNRVYYGWGNVTVQDWPKIGDAINPNAIIPPEMDRKAKALRTHHYQRVLSIDEVKRSLISRYSPTITVPITEDWYDAPGGRIPLPASEKDFVGVHMVAIVGYSDSMGSLQFVNSWGDEWGNVGFGYLPYEYFDKHAIETWIQVHGQETRELALRRTGARESEAHRFDEPIELGWGVQDILRPGIFHCREIYNLATDERLGWAFAVQRDGFLDVEEFFVRPSYRRMGLARRIASMLLDLSAETHSPLRLWVSFADCYEENRPALEATLSILGLSLRNTSQRWAAYVATPGTRTSPLEPIVIPARPTAARGRTAMAAAVLASSLPFGTTRAPQTEGRSIDFLNVSSRTDLEVAAMKGEAARLDEEAPTSVPNFKAVTVLKQLRERRRGAALTDPGESSRHLREARSGGMYGYGDSTRPGC